MKINKKLVAIIFVIALTLSIFSGCSVNDLNLTKQSLADNDTYAVNVCVNDVEIIPLRYRPCHTCDGSGYHRFLCPYPNTYPCSNCSDTTIGINCQVCDGDGIINCSECNGTGVRSETCGSCSGAGSEWYPDPSISIPKEPTIPNSVILGENKSVTVDANLIDGAGTITYQWYNNSVAINGATSSIFNLSTLTVGTHKLKCKLSAPNAVDVYTTEATVTVIPKPNITITEQPTAKEFYIGQAENLTVTATLSNGVGEIEYQWYNGTTAINGATSSTLNLSTLSVGTHQIKCVITSSNAVTVTTNIVDVTIKERPTIIITKQPEDITIVVGDNKTISVTAETLDDNAELKYQWKRDNEPIENATTNSLALNDLPQGTYAFKCELSAENETVESDVATVVVEPKSGGGGGGGITPTPTPTPTESPEPTPTPTASPEPTEPPTDEPTDTTNWFAQIISAIGNFFESIFDWFINLFN